MDSCTSCHYRPANKGLSSEERNRRQNCSQFKIIVECRYRKGGGATCETLAVNKASPLLYRVTRNISSYPLTIELYAGWMLSGFHTSIHVCRTCVTHMYARVKWLIHRRTTACEVISCRQTFPVITNCTTSAKDFADFVDLQHEQQHNTPHEIRSCRFSHIRIAVHLFN